jgi:hypothetical protein
MATAKSLTQLNSQVDSSFPNNTSKLITPTVLRTQQKDLIVSTPYSFFDGVPGASQNVAAGYLIGKSRIIDFNTQIEYLYDSGTTTAVWTVITASGSPGGSTTQLQWNNAGAFGGISGATTNGTAVTFASGALIGTDFKASGSGGVSILNSSGTTVALFGAGGGIGVSLNGGTNIGAASADYWGFAGGTGTIAMTATGSSSNININLVPKGTGVLQSNGVEVVTLSGSQTLTNKTLTSPVVTTGLTTGSVSFALLNTTATTINFGGAATTIAIGAATGTLTLNNATLALTATPSTSASFSTATILTRASGGNLEKIVASGGGTTNFLRADGTWAAPSGSGGMSIGGSITSATAGSVLYAGASGVLAQSNSNFFFDSTNNRLGIGFGTSISARLALGAGTASVPHFILTPSSAAFTGTTDGMLTYQNVSSVPNLVLYKGTGATNVLTTARNSDFATGSASGVLIADTSGNLSKSGDLTALGIFTQTNTITVANTATSTTLLGTLIGSSTLPSSFFAVGKTIKIFVSGTYNQDSGSQDCALKLTIGGVSVGTITFTHNGGLTTVYYDAEFTLTCRTVGASGTIQFLGIGRLNHTGTDLKNYFQISSTSGSINTTGTLAIDLQADWVTANAANSITASIVTATYLN